MFGTILEIFETQSNMVTLMGCCNDHSQRLYLVIFNFKVLAEKTN